ncbi:expressed protein [Phakopsora pachyrhizi]|uniref:Expressed protein n=1 Tax=Phakopsora pachyrhizi TaxID=170000 RepID=A0AAV0BE46_PHAPC|nr:expressed protein [Phakopsora pachyrhizi]
MGTTYIVQLPRSKGKLPETESLSFRGLNPLISQDSNYLSPHKEPKVSRGNSDATPSTQEDSAESESIDIAFTEVIEPCSSRVQPKTHQHTVLASNNEHKNSASSEQNKPLFRGQSTQHRNVILTRSASVSDILNTSTVTLSSSDQKILLRRSEEAEEAEPSATALALPQTTTSKGSTTTTSKGIVGSPNFINPAPTGTSTGSTSVPVSGSTSKGTVPQTQTITPSVNRSVPLITKTGSQKSSNSQQITSPTQSTSSTNGTLPKTLAGNSSQINQTIGQPPPKQTSLFQNKNTLVGIAAGAGVAILIALIGIVMACKSRSRKKKVKTLSGETLSIGSPYKDPVKIIEPNTFPNYQSSNTSAYNAPSISNRTHIRDPTVANPRARLNQNYPTLYPPSRVHNPPSRPPRSPLRPQMGEYRDDNQSRRDQENNEYEEYDNQNYEDDRDDYLDSYYSSGNPQKEEGYDYDDYDDSYPQDIRDSTGYDVMRPEDRPYDHRYTVDRNGRLNNFQRFSEAEDEITFPSPPVRYR